MRLNQPHTDETKAAIGAGVSRRLAAKQRAAYKADKHLEELREAIRDDAPASQLLVYFDLVRAELRKAR